MCAKVLQNIEKYEGIARKHRVLNGKKSILSVLYYFFA